MSEFRQNPITKQWVLVAPNRAKRPSDYSSYSVMHGIYEQDQNCIFCPGKENLSSEIDREPVLGDWEIRVIKNKFSSLEESPIYNHQDFYVAHSGDGEHEIVFTRKHNESIALQSIATVELCLKTFIGRYNELAKKKNLAYVQIFHNHGRDAGASSIHPHFQILATPIIPPHIHSELLGSNHYFQIHHSDIYGDILKEELKVKHRIVHESEHFVVLCPYASLSPFEMWVLPKKQTARFEEMTEEETRHLSFVLKVTLGQLYTKLSDPPLNFYIHTMPLDRGSKTYNEKAFRWHLTVFPRTTIWAGFEFATGIPVNPIPPEVSAKFLKGE